MSFTSHFDCPICGLSEKEIPFYGFSYCNHPICSVCAIKLQKFSKDDTKSDCDYSKCVICKQDISKIIIASSIKQYEDFDESNLLCDNKYSLLFESNSAQKFYNNIMQIVCPHCKTVHDNMEELMKHVEVHKRRYCELCKEFNKCLHFELEIYTDNDYHNHRTKKHPKCKFCEIRFYDDSHLIKHVKDKHFVCDICNRNRGCNAYSTQSELLKHYAKDHFLCEICQASNNINAFESEYNLKTHKVSAHNFSLVGEGLVSVGYGDRDNMRYGARRRARDQDDGFFVEPTTIEIPQTIPTMNCEQEFPRLGGGTEVPAVPVNQQLGTQSLNLDENDTRTAFSSHYQSGASQNDDKLFKKPAVPVGPAPMFHSSKTEKMSDNFAISVKKSAGVLNSEDFPSLSSNGGHPERSYRSGAAGGGLDVSRAVKSTKPSLSPRNTPPFVAPQNNEADFPALPGGSGRKVQHHAGGGGGAPQNGSMWRAAATSKPAARTVTKMNNNINKEKHEKNSAEAPERKSREENETNESVIEAPQQRSKVSLVSPEEFQLTAGKQSTPNNRYQHQSVPDERDFPSLGRPPSSSVSSSLGTGANSSNWAGKSNLSNAPRTTSINHHDPFAIDSKSDFPGLPVFSQPRPVGGGKKKAGKSGFASVASSSVPTPTTNQTGKPASSSNKSAPAHPAPSKMESSAPKQPASLRGIDYIPSVAPTKDPLVVVDSKQFSIMKHAGEHQLSSSCSSSSTIGAQFSISNDFPPMQSPPSGSSSNHFEALSISDHIDDVPNRNNRNNKNNNKENAKMAPKLTSESDFPSLGAPKSKQQGAKTTQQVPKWQPIEKQSQPQPQPQQNAPAVVVSLMDVAMSVAKKQYFSFPDNNERNQSMCESLYDNLATDMATQFLQLSNLYRNRKLSVQDYLNSLQSDFVENLDFIATMLPQMCALLPDIPLQRSLMSNMPKSWSKNLRECTKCDQVLLTSDVTIHHQLAH